MASRARSGGHYRLGSAGDIEWVRHEPLRTVPKGTDVETPGGDGNQQEEHGTWTTDADAEEQDNFAGVGGETVDAVRLTIMHGGWCRVAAARTRPGRFFLRIHTEVEGSEHDREDVSFSTKIAREDHTH